MDSVRRSFVAWRMGVYAITHMASGHRYIGSSRNIIKRWQGHEAHLGARNHVNPHLQRAWTKYGAAAFAFSVLDYVWDAADLRATEQQWITSSAPRYNIRRAVQTQRRPGACGPAKLNQSAVVELRRRAAHGESTAQLAVAFGVHQSTVRRAIRGQGWRHVQGAMPVHLPQGNQKLTEPTVADIRARFARGESGPQLAHDYGVSHALIRQIVTGRAWKQIALVPRSDEQCGGRRNAKVSPQQAAEMKERHSRGETYKQIAVDYGVWPGTCHAIVTGRRYR